MKPLSEGLTKGYIAYLEHFSMDVRGKMSHSALNGQRKSGAKGSSMEFSDFREYSTGDDLRRIDWNSYARTDKLFMKVFLEEKQAEINIFLDCSASMGIDEAKGFYAKLIAASVAYIALKNSDSVNIYAWSEGLKQWRLNNTSRNNFAQIVTFLDGLEFAGQTRLSEAISSAVVKAGRGISLVISDFFIEEEFKESVDRLRYKKQQVSMIQVLSCEDAMPSVGGNRRLTDCETGEYRDITVNTRLLSEYKKVLSHMQAAMKEYCRKTNANFSTVTTNVPIEECVKRFM
ncbi:MAG: DUF58 domain-containing protein [Anaerotignaceae bacterium]